MAAPSPAPVAPLSEKQEYLMEIVAAILLGLATVFGAFSAYQSALYGGQCLTGVI